MHCFLGLHHTGISFKYLIRRTPNHPYRNVPIRGALKGGTGGMCWEYWCSGEVSRSITQVLPHEPTHTGSLNSSLTCTSAQLNVQPRTRAPQSTSHTTTCVSPQPSKLSHDLGIPNTGAERTYTPDLPEHRLARAYPHKHKSTVLPEPPPPPHQQTHPNTGRNLSTAGNTPARTPQPQRPDAGRPLRVSAPHGGFVQPANCQLRLAELYTVQVFGARLQGSADPSLRSCCTGMWF